VTVIGAGVAGMTAATELAERGFRVQLVDAHRDDLPESPVSPGGIAKSQRRRLPDSDRTMTPSRPMLQFNYPVPLDVGDRQFPLADSACRQALVNYEADRRVELQDDMRNPEESEPLWLVDPLRRRLHSPGRRVLPVWVEACRVINDLILGDGAPPEPPELAAVPPGENPPKTESPPVPTRDWYLGIQVRRRADPNTGRLSVRDARIQATAVLHQLKDLLKTSQSDPWHQQVWTLCGWQCEPYEGAIPAHIQAERLSFPQATYKLSGQGPLAGHTVYLQMEAYVIPGNEPWKGVVQVKDRADFRVVQKTVMAEHGYRLFPSFYRHLFDTMTRVPLYDDTGRESGDTLINNLVSPDIWQLADTKNQTGPIPFTRGRLQSLEDLRIFLKKLSRFGYTNRDLALFELRLLKYLCSCEQRRDEAAQKSWKDYMGLGDFSADFQRTITDAPLSLLAMKAEEVDARTYLDVLVQLFLDQTADASRADRILNGPTSDAFFLPWLDYLRRIDVRVFHGNLSAFKREGGRLRPLWNSTGSAKPSVEAFVELKGGYQEPDYYILAIPLERVWQVMAATDVPEEKDVQPDEKQKKADQQKFWSTGGVFSQLWAWRQNVDIEAIAQKTHWPAPSWRSDVVPRDLQNRPVGPFRDMSGIQYYFRTGNRLGGGGHIYYLGAPWGLSTISQPQYWRIRRRPARDGYISNLSVDVCNLYVPGRDTSAIGNKAITTPPADFAKEVWAQLLDAWPAFHRHHLLPPAWYHIDSNLRWRRKPHSEAGCYRNTTPYLINRPGEWSLRPGHAAEAAPESREALLCQDAGLERI
ncbi:MAG TPA: NAD(P)-binding protein, partial [Myxococcota bacterium]|nr:NAD(P)-binding protein [Myxococcota bacterium]